jgi:hypothetical protein
MLRATFQLVPGLGPERERRLWRGSVLDWTQLSQAKAALLRPGLRGPLLAAADAAEEALDAGDLAAVASALPAREHWRLYGAFAERAVYLDIETDLEDGVTAIGILDRTRDVDCGTIPTLADAPSSFPDFPPSCGLSPPPEEIRAAPLEHPEGCARRIATANVDGRRPKADSGHRATLQTRSRAPGSDPGLELPARL